MSTRALAGPQPSCLVCPFNFRIAQCGQPGLHSGAAREHAYHRKRLALLVNDSFRQVHQAATLAIDGLAALSETSNVGAHRLVRGERRCVQLRVAAAQVKSVKAVRQSLLLNRTELDNLRASIGEQIKIVLVIETEGVIASDTNSWWATERLALLQNCA